MGWEEAFIILNKVLIVNLVERTTFEEKHEENEEAKHVGRENGQGYSKYKCPEVEGNLFFGPCAFFEPLIIEGTT